MQILTSSPVPVVLAETHSFKLVVGWFPPVFAGLDKSRSIARSTALRVALNLSEGFIVLYKKVEIHFIKETIKEIFKCMFGCQIHTTTSYNHFAALKIEI